MTFTSMNSDSGLTSIHTMPTNVGDGFFRFTINNTVFRKFFFTLLLKSVKAQNMYKEKRLQIKISIYINIGMW